MDDVGSTPIEDSDQNNKKGENMIKQPGYMKSNCCANCKFSIENFSTEYIFCNLDDTGDEMVTRFVPITSELLKWEENHETKRDMICWNYKCLPEYK